MFFIVALLELSIENKIEITDCYKASSRIRLISIRGVRSFRLYLTQTGKSDCAQLPRGINITVFANNLQNKQQEFQPISFVLFNFSYTTTIGIVIPCLQCTDDSYLQSNQAIITFESVSHFTQFLVGAVQTQAGQQVNCFRRASMQISLNYISVTQQPSGSCPQLISDINSNVLKKVVLADVYIVYQSGTIDRYEKIEIGTNLLLQEQLSSTSPSVYNITIPNIGLKPMKEPLQFLQFQLYFENQGIPLIATRQVRSFTFALYQNAYQYIQMRTQGNSIYVDLQLNDKHLIQYNQLYNDSQIDKVELQFYGYSNSIHPALTLEQKFETSSVSLYTRELPLTFTTTLSDFSFRSQNIAINCNQILESDCQSEFERLKIYNDNKYQFDAILKFYKNGQIIQAMSKRVDQVTDSCFDSAQITLDKLNLSINLKQNKFAHNCSLNDNQNVTLIFGPIQKIIQFKFDLNLDVSSIERDSLLSSKIIQFTVNDELVDFAAVDQLTEINSEAFKSGAERIIILISVFSIIFCFFVQTVPHLNKKLHIQKKKNVVEENDDL
ncbi:Conserved_hypothetical protein [Hexamita inflata]|uniref:Transmembrane protein n=1 Tax=Hexamita inflata TaxID=28002 RepID=A0AA86NKN3_9EUKA|nr:Conserved hypothetical protein [Hexamita inflata]